MSEPVTYIDTLRVEAPAEAAHQVQLRLSTKLAGADLRPPGLAPSQVLLVRELADPDPGRLGLENEGPTLDRTWKQAVLDAVSECLHRAARPSEGRVPSGARAVLFRDAAEAWACWCHQRIVSRAGEVPWWVRSLPVSSDSVYTSGGTTVASRGEAGTRPSRTAPHHLPGVTDVWQTHSRLVPAMAANLTTWKAAGDVIGIMSATEAEAVLRAVCSAYGTSIPDESLAPLPEQSSPADSAFTPPAEADAELSGPSPGTGGDRQSDAEVPMSGTNRDPAGGDPAEPRGKKQASGQNTGRSPGAPWRPYLENMAVAGGKRVRAGLSPVQRQLLGVSLTLHQRPTAARSSDFQAAWRAWQGSGGRSPSGPEQPKREREEPPALESDEAGGSGESHAAEDPSEDTPSPEGRFAGGGEPDRPGHGPAEEGPSPGPEPTRKSAASGEGLRDPSVTSPHDDAPARKGGSSPAEPLEDPDEGEPFLGNPYAATELGGVFYLVNVLEALDLPAVVETPPIGEHVGAWAALDVLARALLGDALDQIRPNDPVWHVLAELERRPFKVPMGQALDAALAERNDPKAYRMPPAWLDPPPIRGPVDGSWGVVDGRLRVWTNFGCVADLVAPSHPSAQARREWEQLPTGGRLHHAETADAMPLSSRPAGTAPLLAHWAQRVAPFIRARLAAALGKERTAADWIVPLFTLRGRVYSTDTHIDLVLPLDAARVDVRAAGLDRSPGWWAAGGRVIHFHFVEKDEGGTETRAE